MCASGVILQKECLALVASEGTIDNVRLHRFIYIRHLSLVCCQNI